MSSTASVLTLLTDAGLREGVDRVGAAVDARIIHIDAAPGQPPLRRKTWSAATAVVLDTDTARRCTQSRLPRRAHVIVVTGTEPTAATWQAAIAVGAQHVLTLPAAEHDLVRALADAGESVRDTAQRGAVIAVIGGSGGAGASVFAAALAQAGTEALLVDLDPWSGGIDLLIGSDDAAGLRWPDLALQGGRLSWSALRDALPHHRGVSVLSVGRHGCAMEAAPVSAVVDAGRRGGATVICDLPRCLSSVNETALDAADLAVVVGRCEVRACAATAAFAPGVCAVNPNTGLVVRGPSPGGLRAAEVAEIAGLRLLASTRSEPRLAEQLERNGLRLRRRSALAAAARQVLAVLPARLGPAAAKAGAA